MKKYLMTGVAALAMCVAFTSCSKDEVIQLTENEKKAVQYSESFVKTFGVTIDPDNDWGFGAVSPAASNSYITRGNYPNANLWDSKYIVPDDPEMNSYEITKVTDYFTKNSFTDAVTCVDFANFFVYQISSTENGSHMDNLKCGKKGGTMEHVEHFNAGTGTNNDWHGRSMCIEGGSSEYWTYESSVGTKHTFDHFYAVEGSVIDSRLAGYYYIGFDYESLGGSDSQAVAPDGKYNDWIIRISEAEFNHTNWQGRIFCEDLGAIGDFDFNDVVFDYDLSDWGKTWIRVICAGGTLPLYICGTEVHALFGVDTNVMVNTGRGPEKPVKIFFVNQTFNSPANIPIQVGEAAQNNDGTTSENLRTIVAEKGKAPQKVCVQWALPDPQTEKLKISEKYPKFTNYIEDHTIRWWE